MLPCSDAALANTALSAHKDLYGGVVIDVDALPASAGEFKASLQHSLQVWANHCQLHQRVCNLLHTDIFTELHGQAHTD